MKYTLIPIDRIVYIWARYSGKRTPDGKDYSKSDLNELIRRLEKFRDDPISFDEGFEKSLEGIEDEE